MINVYYTTPVDLRTILKDTDPINCVYAFIIVAEEVYHTVWLYRGSDGKFKPNGTAMVQQVTNIYICGYTIEANWVE